MDNPQYTADAPRSVPTLVPPGSPDHVAISATADRNYSKSVLVVVLPVKLDATGTHYEPVAKPIEKAAWWQALEARADDMGFTVEPPLALWSLPGTIGGLVLIVYQGRGRGGDTFPEQVKFFSAAGANVVQEAAGAGTAGPAGVNALAALPAPMSKEAARALTERLASRTAAQLQFALVEP